MDEDQVWTAIDEQRERVATMLEGLDAGQWAHPSLCEGWTVRDVGAHLTVQEASAGWMLREGLLHPAPGLNAFIHRGAKREAARLTEAEIVDRIRGMAGHRRHNFGLTKWEPLIDILVHGLDIAIPLGLELEVPADAAAAIATRIHGQHGRGKASVFRKVPVWAHRLEATDHPWAIGAGPEIRGPMVALLLLLTGRTARQDELHGPGLAAYRQSVAARA